ncbi:60S ribosomal protein L23A-like [Papaver somniferum]|uniref:60S ribosomal protein L23A-like n=1 Tax=Papaver somniferum TaxID=3469 RepID=UPI000E6FF3FA|nr:60S ribosomal protein L23A-like [Papaver somniferum]
MVLISFACHVVTKKADPKVLANKASKAVKAGASTIKKKAKNICTSVIFHRPKTLQKDNEETDRNPDTAKNMHMALKTDEDNRMMMYCQKKIKTDTKKSPDDDASFMNIDPK